MHDNGATCALISNIPETDLCDVGFGVEVPEQDDKGDHVNHQGVLHPEREVASGSDTVNAQY